MPDLAAELATHLKTMRKGHGLLDAAFTRPYPQALLYVLNIPESSTAAELRAAVETMLVSLAQRLPDDLRVALLVGFGLHADARLRFYEDRIGWLAGRLGRDKRTAKRRVDKACDRVVELAVDAARRRASEPAAAGHDSEWHTELLSTVVAFAGRGPEIIETRRIVCHQAGVELIDLAITITGSAPASGSAMASSADLGVDVLRGGILGHKVMESSRRTGLMLRLSHPLAVDERVEFMLRYRIPPDKEIRPHYVSVPRYPCDRFELCIRFGADRPPTACRLHGVFQDDVDDPAGVGDDAPVDAVGEIRATFDDLKPGFAYGVRWAWPEPS